MAEALAATYIRAGPLTTTFVPDPACTSLVRDGNTRSFLLFGKSQALSSESCFPSSFNTDGVLGTANYYSPGRCPFAYTPYTIQGTGSSNLGSQNVGSTNSVPNIEEHTFVCCPRNFAPETKTQGGWDRGCASIISSPTVVTYLTAADKQQVPYSTTIASSVTIPVFAYGIQVRFASTDLAVLDLKTDELSQYGLSTSGSSTDFIIQSTSEVSFTSTFPTPSQSVAVNGGYTPPQGLSSGAKIAIGLCVPFACLLLLLSTFFLLRRRSRCKGYNNSPHLPATGNEGYSNPPEHVIAEAGSSDSYFKEHYHPHKHEVLEEVDGRSLLPTHTPGYDGPQELDAGTITRHEVA